MATSRLKREGIMKSMAGREQQNIDRDGRSAAPTAGDAVNLHNQHGSSLMEVFVSMIIMMLLVVGLNNYMASFIRGNLASKQLVAATAEGNALFEELRRSDYGSIANGNDIARNSFSRSWTVSSDQTQKRIDLVVAWPVSSPKHSIQLSTIIAKP
jgi:Tfp pilus assembly protein PilV